MDKVALVSALLVKVFDKFSAVGLEVIDSSPLIIITFGVNCNISTIRQLKTDAGYMPAICHGLRAASIFFVVDSENLITSHLVVCTLNI